MVSTASPADGCAVAVFVKAPVPGTVKTRLADLLGDDGAAKLHEELARRALATARNSGLSPLQLWCSPDTSHEFFARAAAEYGAELHAQEGVGLGERMRAAFDASLEKGRNLVLIGSDCPGLDASHLRDAATQLATHDVVMAPAEDGGYVLIALSRAIPGLFDNVSWGTSSVMSQTRERVAAAGCKWMELSTFWDVDRPGDYERLKRGGLLEEMRS